MWRGKKVEKVPSRKYLEFLSQWRLDKSLFQLRRNLKRQENSFSMQFICSWNIFHVQLFTHLFPVVTFINNDDLLLLKCHKSVMLVLFSVFNHFPKQTTANQRMTLRAILHADMLGEKKHFSSSAWLECNQI